MKIMKKIALPIVDNKLSPHFGHCQYFSVFSIDNNEIKNIIELIPPPHEPGLLPGWLAEKGVTDIISGGMGQRAIDIFNQNNINVHIGAQIKEAKELILDYIEGTLDTNENSCDH